MASLKGKVAVVTGASRGIGRGIAERLAKDGATIVVNYTKRAGEAEKVVSGIKGQGGNALAVQADVSKVEDIKRLFQETKKVYGRLDILVNNAGIPGDAFLEMASQEMVQEVFDTNTLGSVYHLQEASRLMSRKRSGSIINISSIVGRTGNGGQTVYAASKAALLGLTYAAAKELAPINIRVNAIAPGFIRTEMTAALPESLYAERLASVKMGRIGEPDDVANAVLFFASDLSAYITGQVLGVDGAMLI